MKTWSRNLRPSSAASSRSSAWTGAKRSRGYREQAERRSVATPSCRQVTREIYRESIGRWRAYGDALAPLQPALAPYVAAFGYRRD